MTDTTILIIGFVLNLLCTGIAIRVLIRRMDTILKGINEIKKKLWQHEEQLTKVDENSLERSKYADLGFNRS